MTTVPCVGVVFAVTVRPLPMSLANTVEPLSVVFAEVVVALLTATGFTVMLTVAVVVWPLASVAVYVNESGPL